MNYKLPAALAVGPSPALSCNSVLSLLPTQHTQEFPSLIEPNRELDLICLFGDSLLFPSRPISDMTA